MTRRRAVVKYPLDNGFVSKGGTRHEKFSNGSVTVMVKRHAEIEDEVFEKIKRQAGLA